MQLKVKRLHPDAKLPTRAHDGDAGLDLYYCGTTAIELHGGCWYTLETGIAVAIPYGFVGEVRPRSGLARSHGITVLNSPGTIDSGYRGEIKVILAMFGPERFILGPGSKIAQLVIVPVALPTVEEVAELDETDRGDRGLGSSGR